MISVGDEADLVAVGLAGDGEPELAGLLPHRVLSRSPTGNIACASCAWSSVKRKYDWSFAGSAPRFRR